MNDNKMPGTNQTGHDFVLKDRKSMQISGVKEIISFDDKSIVLSTMCGEMAIDGENLHVRVLNVDSGNVALDGLVSSVYYYDSPTNSQKSEKSGLFSKLFK